MLSTDPREHLLTTGAALLDVIYRQATWEHQHPNIVEALKARKGGEDVDTSAVVNSPDFVDAFISSMEISAEYHRLYREYTMLRSTIEALETPRPPISWPE